MQVVSAKIKQTELNDLRILMQMGDNDAMQWLLRAVLKKHGCNNGKWGIDLDTGFIVRLEEKQLENSSSPEL